MAERKGRDLMLAELLAHSESSDHFRLHGRGAAEIELATRVDTGTDKIVGVAKLLLRLDDWDRKHFPRLLDDVE